MISYGVIGKHIKEARLRAGFTQEEIAYRINISAAYFGKIERGVIKPNIARLVEISQELGIPFECLFQGAIFPEGKSMGNFPVPKEEFDAFFQEIGKTMSERNKTIVMRVCGELSRLLESEETFE
ncbi:MAG: helix-turn-helix domain-containing protein [Clostridia bacterium]|nr:helix-turn-helix domain-containing protein [Clostridia bacterium]